MKNKLIKIFIRIIIFLIVLYILLFFFLDLEYVSIFRYNAF